ncbi:MAG: RsmG family class I SAM-dependent methyltransferase [Polyangiaceae bacterium]
MASKLQTKGSAWNLAPYADALGVRLSPTSTSHLETWLDGIATWNARIDLTAARSDDELLDLMLADALVVSKHVPEGASVVDVGTGAGAPGFALALARPDLRVTLVEPLAKRVSFLRTMIGTTLRTDVTLVRDRGESIRARGTTFDVAMARATLAPPEWLALGASLVRPGGDVWVLLAREPAPSGVGTAIETIPYTWPRTGAERTLVRYRT